MDFLLHGVWKIPYSTSVSTAKYFQWFKILKYLKNTVWMSFDLFTHNIYRSSMNFYERNNVFKHQISFSSLNNFFCVLNLLLFFVINCCPANINLLKIIKRNTRTGCVIYSKVKDKVIQTTALTKNQTMMLVYWHYINDIVLVYLFSISNIFLQLGVNIMI